MGYHFISYSGVDAEDFAVRLVRELAGGPSASTVWLDKRELKPGLDWDDQIGQAIQTCDSLLFVMTHDSVMPSSVCKREWTLALKHNKPVIPLRLHFDAELPFRLEPRQYIDFSGEFEPGLTRLRAHLQWLSGPEGRLQALKDRLADAMRGLSRTPEQDRPRAAEEVADLERRVAEQQNVVAAPQAEPQVQGGAPRRRGEDRRGSRWIDRRRGDQPPSASKAPSQPERPVKALDPAVLERARQDLAVYIGPMARVIVNRVAEDAPSVADLYKALAAEIESPSDRQKFLASRAL